MSSNKPWSRQKLTQMLYHAFIGSLADNAIEIGWVLCFSLLADKSLVERITVLFGVNDAFWVVLSSTYYTARTSMTAALPKLIEKQGLSIESKVVKNHVYLFYLMLLPSAIGSFMFLPKLATHSRSVYDRFTILSAVLQTIDCFDFGCSTLVNLYTVISQN